MKPIMWMYSIISSMPGSLCNCMFRTIWEKWNICWRCQRHRRWIERERQTEVGGEMQKMFQRIYDSKIMLLSCLCSPWLSSSIYHCILIWGIQFNQYLPSSEREWANFRPNSSHLQINLFVRNYCQSKPLASAWTMNGLCTSHKWGLEFAGACKCLDHYTNSHCKLTKHIAYIT